MIRGTEIIVKRVAAAVACVLVIGFAGPVFADRHCSFARESAFYAREFSAEALGLPVAGCSAKTARALDRLRDARTDLRICSCAPAEEPLEFWFKKHPSSAGVTATSCRNKADAVNAISREILTQVEKCF